MRNLVKLNTINCQDYIMFGNNGWHSFICIGKVVGVEKCGKSATRRFTIEMRYEKMDGEWVPTNRSQTFTTEKRYSMSIKVLKLWKDEENFIHDMFCELV